jgi:uncharacterized short protein YbdD (DUF466 family)
MRRDDEAVNREVREALHPPLTDQDYDEYLNFRVAMLRCKHDGKPTWAQLQWQPDGQRRRGNGYLGKAEEELRWAFLNSC